MLYIIFSFYYKEGEKPQTRSYINAVFAFDLLLFFNLVAIAGLLNIGIGHLVPWSGGDSTGLMYAKALFLFAIPISLITMLLFRRDMIVNLKYADGLVEKGKVWVIVYGILSVVAALVLAKK